MTRFLMLLILCLAAAALPTGAWLGGLRRRRTLRWRAALLTAASDRAAADRRSVAPPVGEELPEPGRAGVRLRRVVPWAAGAGVAALAGGLLGCGLGAVVGAVLHRWLPRPAAAGGDAPGEEHSVGLLEAQLPLTADLLSACFGASGAPADAAAAVARAVPTPMRDLLAAVAAELRMGADPVESWARLGADCPALAPLGRCLARADACGAPPAASLARLADEQRTAAARAAAARTRRAGVLATAPLGLCFLPAFVLTGIVPVVAGLAATYLGRP